MPITAAVIFSLALVPYILAWKYIRQLVRDVNGRATANRMSIWWWHKGWRMHSQLFPMSSVRLRIVTCFALAAGLGLVAFCIAARNLFIHR
jgi:hypothetical protein